MHSSERWIIGTLLTIALLTFFLPLASLQLPVLGTQDVSGYDLFNKAKEFSQSLDSVKDRTQVESGSEPAQSSSGNQSEADSASSLPLSVQALPLVPVEIILSYVCALIALFSCIESFRLATLKLFSAIGTLAAVAGIIGLAIANSDLHTWISKQLQADSSALSNNPFAGLAQQIASMAANSSQIKPGVGGVPGLFCTRSDDRNWS